MAERNIDSKVAAAINSMVAAAINSLVEAAPLISSMATVINSKNSAAAVSRNTPAAATMVATSATSNTAEAPINTHISGGYHDRFSETDHPPRTLALRPSYTEGSEPLLWLLQQLSGNLAMPAAIFIASSLEPKLICLLAAGLMLINGPGRACDRASATIPMVAMSPVFAQV